MANQKNIALGGIFLGIGSAALWQGAGHDAGSLARMGPGYFPMMVSGLLVLVGASICGRALFAEPVELGAVDWKPILLVAGSTLLFGLLIGGLGFLLTTTLVILVAAACSRHFKLGVAPVIAMLGFVGLCALLFVQWLGIPIPLVGDWL